MKQKLLIPIGCLIIGLLIGSGFVSIICSNKLAEKEKENKRLEKILKNARKSVIKANVEYNLLFNKMGVAAMRENNQYAYAAAMTLQEIMPYLLDINKELKIDCKKYQDGEPVMIEDEYGNKNPGEVLPDELRVID